MDSFFLDNLSLLFLQKVATWSKLIPPFNASTVLFFRSFRCHRLGTTCPAFPKHLSDIEEPIALYSLCPPPPPPGP
jgi:hypothetical protein